MAVRIEQGLDPDTFGLQSSHHGPGLAQEGIGIAGSDERWRERLADVTGDCCGGHEPFVVCILPATRVGPAHGPHYILERGSGIDESGKVVDPAAQGNGAS